MFLQGALDPMQPHENAAFNAAKNAVKNATYKQFLKMKILKPCKILVILNCKGFSFSTLDLPVLRQIINRT